MKRGLALTATALLNAEKRYLNGMKCLVYGYYDEAMAEFEKAAEAIPESRGSLERNHAER